LRPLLAVDVDSTIWDPGAWVSEAVLEITGETLDLESVTGLTSLFDLYDEEAAVEVIDRAFSPRRVRDREPYPGAPEILRNLREEQNIGIHFVTRNHDPVAMIPHLDPWLRGHFGPDVGLTVTAGEKLPVLRELGAFGLVDDLPDTLGRVADAGLWAAAKSQPWNREFVAQRPDVHGFSDWREVPNLLPPLPC
jgi:hypothetical protein